MAVSFVEILYLGTNPPDYNMNLNHPVFRTRAPFWDVDESKAPSVRLRTEGALEITNTSGDS